MISYNAFHVTDVTHSYRGITILNIVMHHTLVITNYCNSKQYIGHAQLTSSVKCSTVGARLLIVKLADQNSTGQHRSQTAQNEQTTDE